MSEGLHDLVRKAAANPKISQRLREDPDSLKQELGLSDSDLAALRDATHLIVTRDNPLKPTTTLTFDPITITAGANFQTTHPITITAKKVSPRDSGDFDPERLDDLSQQELVELTRRILEDADFADRVREFLGIESG